MDAGGSARRASARASSTHLSSLSDARPVTRTAGPEWGTSAEHQASASDRGPEHDHLQPYRVNRALDHKQSADINAQAASSTVDVAKLQAAFQNVYATMDEIDSFRVEPSNSMQKTVGALSAEKITKSQAYLDRARER